MKNKILASLLAVCLFVGLAVPAFATSSQSAANEDITAIGFTEASYTVKKGENVKLAEKVVAFAGTKKITQDASFTWSIANDDKFAFMLDDASGVVTANEEAGTAVITVTANEGKVKQTIKVVAAKADAVVGATGFTFASTSTTLFTGGAVKAEKGDRLEIVPTPKGATFSNAQKEAIKNAITGSVLNFVAPKGDGVADVTVVPTVTTADDKITVIYPVGTAKAATIKVVFATNGTNPAAATPEITIKAAAGPVPAVTVKGNEVKTNALPADVAISFVGKTFVLDGYTFKGALDATDVAKTTVIFTATAKGKTAAFTDIASAANVTNITTMTSAITGNGTEGTAAPTTLSAITTAKVDAQKVSLEVAFPRFDDKGTPNKIIRNITLSGKAARDVDYINATGSIKIEVGQVEDLPKYFKQGPTAANITQDVEYSLEYADMNKVIGVAVGTNKVTAKIDLANGTTSTATIIVNVVEKGTLKPATELKLANAHPKMVTKGTHQIKVSGLAADAKVEYKVLAGSEAYVSVDDKGVVTALKATPAGTIAKVYVTVDGKDVSLYTNVTITDLPTTTDPVKPTTPPATGV